MTGGTLSVSGALELNGGARVTQSGGTIDVIDFDSRAAGGTFTQSGGTFRIYRNFVNSGVFDSTGGTIVFAGTGDGANAFKAPGRNQFFNVVVNSGVYTDFSSKSDAQILVARQLDDGRHGGPDWQEHQGDVQRERRADHRRRAGDHLRQPDGGQAGRRTSRLPARHWSRTAT